MPPQPSSSLEVTTATRLTRSRKRGAYDRDTIYRILDAGILCHIGFEYEGRPFVLPTAYVRERDHLLVHGAANGRLFKTLAEGVECCLTVSHLDGLVLARSAFHHSVNYRSVMVLGRFAAIENRVEKMAALDTFVEGCIPGRSQDNIRSTSEKELNATAILRLEISEASAKVRCGPPMDDEEDMKREVWAGVIDKKPPRYTLNPAPELPSQIVAPSYLGRAKF